MKDIQVMAVAVVLVIGALTDIKFKKIPLWLIMVAGSIGVVLCIIRPIHSGGELILGVLIGVLLIMVSFVSEGQVGMGDGLLFVVLGIYLGSGNVMLFVLSLVLCATVAGVLYAAKKVKRKDRLPFVPFVLCAYIFQLMLTGI